MRCLLLSTRPVKEFRYGMPQLIFDVTTVQTYTCWYRTLHHSAYYGQTIYNILFSPISHEGTRVKITPSPPAGTHAKRHRREPYHIGGGQVVKLKIHY